MRRMVRKENPEPIQEFFPDEQLFEVQGMTPGYADLANYLVGKILPDDVSRGKRNKIKSEAKYYVWDEPYL